MKKLTIVFLVLFTVGCVGLKRDLRVLNKKLDSYVVLVHDLKTANIISGGDAKRADEYLRIASAILDQAEIGLEAGDKIESREYVKALEEVMVILERYERLK